MHTVDILSQDTATLSQGCAKVVAPMSSSPKASSLQRMNSQGWKEQQKMWNEREQNARQIAQNSTLTEILKSYGKDGIIYDDCSKSRQAKLNRKLIKKTGTSMFEFIVTNNMQHWTRSQWYAMLFAWVSRHGRK